jgi:CcmD family protein
MTATEYVLTANCVVWVFIGMYVFWMSRKAAEIDRRIVQLEVLQERGEGKV